MACAVLGLVTLAFFAPLAFGRTFSTVPGHQSSIWPWKSLPTTYVDSSPQTDQADSYHPWQSYVSRTLRSGTIPLWNRHSFGGAPFLVNGQNGALYPPRVILSLTVPVTWVHDILLMVHVFFAGLAMWALLRELGCRSSVALFGGIAWMLNGHVLAFMQLEFIGPLAVFLPTSLLFVVKLGRRPCWAYGVGAGLSLAMTVVGGQVQLAMMVWLVVSLYALALLVVPLRRAVQDRSVRTVARQAVTTAAVPVVAVAASAVVLFPTLAAAAKVGRRPFSYRALVTEFATPLGGIGHAVWPWGLPLTSTQLMGFAVFAGTPTVLLAIVGVFSRRPGTTLGRIMTIVTLLITIGGPVTWVAYHLVPGLGFLRPLGRLLFFFGFGLCLLAALGLESVVARVTRRPAAWANAGAAALTGLCLVATTAQLLWYGREVNPPFPPRDPSLLYPRTGLINALEADRRSRPTKAPQRFLPLTRPHVPGKVFFAPVLYTSQQMVFGLDSAGGYESVVPSRVVNLWRVVAGEDPRAVVGQRLTSGFLTTFPAGITRLDLLGRVGVTTLVGSPELEAGPTWNPGYAAPLTVRRTYKGPDGLIFDVAGGPGAAWVTFSVEVARSREEALRRFADPDFNHLTTVLLEGSVPRSAPVAAGGRPPAASVLSVDRGINTMSIDVRSSAPGWLVIADTWAPGWTATVNGRRTEVLRGNYTFRTVKIPAGRSQVALSYRPPGFVTGAILSGTTAVVIATAFVVRALPHRRRRATATQPDRAPAGESG